MSSLNIDVGYCIARHCNSLCECWFNFSPIRTIVCQKMAFISHTSNEPLRCAQKQDWRARWTNIMLLRSACCHSCPRSLSQQSSAHLQLCPYQTSCFTILCTLMRVLLSTHVVNYRRVNITWVKSKMGNSNNKNVFRFYFLIFLSIPAFRSKRF
jgi:hypothetical protein